MKTKIALTALAFSALTSCAGLQNKPFTCPQKGGAAWTEVKSPHFILYTDLDRDVAEKTSRELEATLSALSSLGFGVEEIPSVRVEVIYFRRDQEGQAVLGKLVGGGFNWSGLHDLERMPVAIVYGDFVNRTRRTFQHELTHMLVHSYYGQVPVWLNEGMAQYLETLDIEDGKAVIGRQPSAFRFWLGRYKYEADGPQGWFAHIPVGEAIAVSELIKMSSTTFYDKKDADPLTAQGQEAMRVRTTHYASAWNLVHLLISNDKYAPAYNQLIKGMQSGQSFEAAWQTSVGELPADQLEADYREAMVPHETKTLRTAFDKRPSAPDGVRSLSDPEVHLLWARLRSWDDEADSKAAASEIAEAAAADPDSASVALGRAAWSLHKNEASEAVQTLSRVSANSKDARILNALGWAKLATFAGRKMQAADVEREVGPIAKQLTPMASLSAHFDFLARYSEYVGDLDGAIQYEKRATSLDPQCVACLRGAAHLLDKKGNAREAVEVATFAVGVLPDGARSEDLEADVAQYKQHLAASAAPAGSARTPASSLAAKRAAIKAR